MARMTRAKVRYNLMLFSGLLLFLINVWVFFYSYDELNQPAPISLYRWVLSVSIGWLLLMRLMDIHKEGRLTNG